MATATANEKRRSNVRFITHYQLDHTPTTDILTRIKEASKKKEVLLNVKITPDIARDLLTVNPSNRHVRLEDTRRWTKDMIAGKWIDTGVPLLFSWDMKLLDGQHRLIAIIESGKTQVYNIVTGLPPEAYNVIDTGRIRTAGDVISDLNFKNYNVMASAIKSEIYWQKYGKLGTNLNQSRVANYEVKEWVMNMAEMKLMVLCVEYAANFLQKNASFLSASSWAFVFFILSRRNRTTAEYFVTALATGENISRTKDPAIYLLREKMISFSAKKSSWANRNSVSFVVKMHYIITAWNLFRLNKKPTELSINLKATEFPKPQ
jgi:hypothetical protein